jgi:hypothetical protein
MLGRSEKSFPPIELVNTVPMNVSAGVEAYVRLNDQRIYVVTTSRWFQDARESRDRCGDVMAIRKIASVLIHEEVHLRQGADEKTAYQAQLTMLTALGAGLGSPPYMEVVRAMRHVEQQRRKPARLMAAAVQP